MEKLTLAMFTPHVDSRFSLQLPDATLPADLIEAKPLGSGRSQPLPAYALPEGITLREQPFSLVFRLPRRPALNQATYTLTHPEMGTLEHIFLVPIAENESGRFYESVFN